MRRESRNWKLVKDKSLLEFEEGGEHLSIKQPTFEFINCEDCNSAISVKENWQAFLKTSPITKGLGIGKGYNFRTTVEFYCQKCSE